MNLSIIIVSYNTKKLLKRCLESLEQETRLQSPEATADGGQGERAGEWKIEIIVVDNGSTDDSVEMVKSITGIRSTTGATGIKLIENKENLGFAKAVNQALRQAQGEAVLLLNSDTIVKKGALKKLVEFEKQVRPAIIGARMLNPDGTIQASCFYLPTVGRAIKEYWFNKSGYFSKYAPLGDKPVEVEAVIGAGFLIPKKIVEKIGLLDERYFMYFEDLDYCRRAKKAGFKVYYLPTAEIIHEHGSSGRKLAAEENQWRRLIPSSKIYHGILKYYLLTFIIWMGQKWQKYFS